MKKQNLIIWILLVIAMLFAFYLLKIYLVKVEKINDDRNKRVLEEDVMDKKIENKNVKTIYLAGGCFWGVEEYFSRVYGIVDSISGYANGKSDKTDYQTIKFTGHAETVKIDYDISKISLEEILLHYFRIINPTTVNRQGNDVGVQYRTGVYYVNDEDEPIIDKIFELESKKHGEIAVEKEKLRNFVTAEQYHQDYLKRNPNGYCHIDLSDANKPLFEEKYENPNEDKIKESLDDLSYRVLRQNDTEMPHTSELNSEYRKGIYVDKITGEPLFASKDKFDSGCGWPSFSKPILTDKIDYLDDDSLGRHRIEVRSKSGDNHLGHVFEDGPKDKGGLRYCINGASITFIPYEEMKSKGYEKYMVLCE